MDTFENMDQKLLLLADRVVKEEMGGTVDPKTDYCIIPLKME